MPGVVEQFVKGKNAEIWEKQKVESKERERKLEEEKGYDKFQEYLLEHKRIRVPASEISDELKTKLTPGIFRFSRIGRVNNKEMFWLQYVDQFQNIAWMEIAYEDSGLTKKVENGQEAYQNIMASLDYLHFIQLSGEDDGRYIALLQAGKEFDAQEDARKKEEAVFKF